MKPMSGIFLVLATLALLSRPAVSLSDSVCKNTAATWNTDSPRLTGQFPFYSMLFFCEGNLNLESLNVDACINNGTSCGQPAADEFCQYLGFEGCVPTLYTTTAANGPARSMTGEWCIQAGEYANLGYLNLTDLEAVNATINGPTCERLDSVVCFNSRARLGQNNQNLHPLAQAPAQAPPAQAPAAASSSPVRTVAGPTSGVELPPSTATGGRRLLSS